MDNVCFNCENFQTGAAGPALFYNRSLLKKTKNCYDKRR